jgi:hypothetical protein
MRNVAFRVPSALDQIRQIHAIPPKRFDPRRYKTLGI